MRLPERAHMRCFCILRSQASSKGLQLAHCALFASERS